MSLVERAQAIRQRLLNPPNAVRDTGIDLKRPPAGSEFRLLRSMSEPQSQSIVPQQPRQKRPPGRIPENVVSQVIRYVADYYGFKVRDVLSSEKAAQLVRIRYTTIYIIRRCSDASFPNIGRRMGGRDHTTILHNHGLAAKRIEEDSTYAAEVAAVEKMVREKLGLPQV